MRAWAVGMNDFSISLPGGAASVLGIYSGDPLAVGMVVAGWVLVTLIVCGRDILKTVIETKASKKGPRAK